MGNSFLPPDKKQDGLFESYYWDILKNRFSGKFLFQYNFYHLITGNLQSLDYLNNKWFFKEIFNYSLKNKEINFLPALRKISNSNRFDEIIRLSASELIQIIEERILINKTQGHTITVIRDEDRIENAKKILADTRTPQTTEILRLLRDKSIEVRRFGLFLIGKFWMTDMTLEVCGSLSIRGIQRDAFMVLQSLGNEAEKELNRFYLASSGNLVTSKAVLSLLSKIRSRENGSFLLERVWSNSRQLKEIALAGLINSGFKADNDEKRRLENLVYETCDLLVWIVTAKVSLQDNGAKKLAGELEKDFLRWKTFLSNILTLTFDGSELSESKKDLQTGKDDIGRNIPEIVGILLNITSKSGELQDNIAAKKMLKKLKKFFHFEIPQYKDLPEEILNCDYNTICVWTKASTLRNNPEIKGEDLAESVIALLFSPLEMLREEAALLLFRSGVELNRSGLERLPDSYRTNVDLVMSGKKNQQEFLFEKVIFLSQCFCGIPEDDLLFLSEKMVTIKNMDGEDMPACEDSIIWHFTNDDSLTDVIIQHKELVDYREIKHNGNTSSYYYVLPFEVIEEFSFQYPESISLVLRYIDKNEE